MNDHNKTPEGTKRFPRLDSPVINETLSPLYQYWGSVHHTESILQAGLLNVKGESCNMTDFLYT